VGDKNALRGDEEGAIENLWIWLLTILDNLLTVDEPASMNSELPGLTITQEAS
jgi:hypothetical protein